jgi:hypothetical protein
MQHVTQYAARTMIAGKCVNSITLRVYLPRSYTNLAPASRKPQCLHTSSVSKTFPTSKTYARSKIYSNLLIPRFRYSNEALRVIGAGRSRASCTRSVNAKRRWRRPSLQSGSKMSVTQHLDAIRASETYVRLHLLLGIAQLRFLDVHARDTYRPPLQACQSEVIITTTNAHCLDLVSTHPTTSFSLPMIALLILHGAAIYITRFSSRYFGAR